MTHVLMVAVIRNVMGGGNVVFKSPTGRTVHVRSYSSVPNARRAVRTEQALRGFCRDDPREAIEWIRDDATGRYH